MQGGTEQRLEPMNKKTDSLACNYVDASPTWANSYVWPALTKILAEYPLPEKRAMDLGCGNGATANMLSQHGFDVTGVDLSHAGISIGQKAFPHLRLQIGSVYDDLASIYGQFPLVVSLEVIEHCFDPRRFAKTFFDLIAPEGVGVLSTPYHGYWKNLALAVTGKWDRHLTALWDGGHVKFFSIETLRSLLIEAGFRELRFIRVGRIPVFAKSMIAIARK
jgi:2-polyprenyl-6-hydroxyphenyl methylase/3-demethylubiquinone-9 3-methyltransferase